ncbi:AMP-binding protein [Actinomadura keratinilytica]
MLYTSGTTGRPKGIVRDNGGHAVALLWSMRNIYDASPGDVFWTASDVGWVVGHSYIVYGPLLLGATTVLYEGKPVGTPDAGAFWRVVADHRVSTLFTAPTAFRAIRKADPEAALLDAYDTSSLRHLFLAGERLDPDTYHWAGGKLGVPVIDHWWQTETGWPVAADPMGLEPLPLKPGSPTVPVPGYDVRVLRADGEECAAGEEGALAIRLPLPPGTLPTVWGDDDRYVASYLSAFPGYYLTGDGGYLDEDGYLFVMGRTDDVINVAGHRLSTGAIEAVLAGHPEVAECAVIGAADPLKGQLPRGLVVPKAGAGEDPERLASELVARVREEIGAVAAFRRVDIVPALPKTRSGKILRKTMRSLADGRDEPPLHHRGPGGPGRAPRRPARLVGQRAPPGARQQIGDDQHDRHDDREDVEGPQPVRAPLHREQALPARGGGAARPGGRANGAAEAASPVHEAVVQLGHRGHRRPPAVGCCSLHRARTGVRAEFSRGR